MSAPPGYDSGLPLGGKAVKPVVGDRGPARRRRRVSDWRVGGRSVRGWDSRTLAGALGGLGVGMLAGAAARAIGLPNAPLYSTVALWVGMSSAIVFAFLRGRPARLLRFRSIDLVWGFGFGLILRLIQGWLGNAALVSFPSAGTLDGGLPADWWLTTALPAVLVGPVIEELFFRCVVLIGIYQLLRRSVGAGVAGLASVLCSSAAFVLLHSVFEPISSVGAIQLFVVGVTCSVLVLLTGRIWGAVLAHVLYNATFIFLVAIGSLLR